IRLPLLTETRARVTPPQQQLNRSCESCRSLKVRCLPNPSTPNQCQRCAKSRKSCVFVAPQRRRPRKRTDSRVAQLEKEMRMMRSLLKGRIREESEPESDGSEASQEEGDDGELEYQGNVGAMPESSSNSARLMDYSPEYGDGSYPSMHGSAVFPAQPTLSGLHMNFLAEPNKHNEDVIDRGIITLDDAEQLVAFFIQEQSSIFPMVMFPQTTTAAHLRQAKPVLFLSVITAAAISIDSGLAAVLSREMVRLYADRFFIEGEKSLELVQAVILMIIYYLPPRSPLRLQFYQYTHIAATMALEIGLATKRRVSKKSDRKQAIYDESLAEQARAVLGCYHLGSIVAMKTRRPNLLQFNDWISECITQLEQSPHRSDQQLAVWFELQRITDEAKSSFGLDDTSTSSPLTESRVQAVLRWFDKRMDTWRKTAPMEMLTVPMILEYRSAILAMYELGVGEGYRDPDAIKRRYFVLPTLEGGGANPPEESQMSAIRIDINVKWMNAAHELLEAVLTCSAETLRRLPNLMFTRFGMAMTSLMKIHFSVRTSTLGEVVTPETVNLSYYLDAMAAKLGDASGGVNTRFLIGGSMSSAQKVGTGTRGSNRDMQACRLGMCKFLLVLARRQAQVQQAQAIATALLMGQVQGWSRNPPGTTPEYSPVVSMPGTQAPTSHMDSFPMTTGVPHMPPGIEPAYVPMNNPGIWHMDSQGQGPFFQSMPPGYSQQTSLPPQFAYEPQPLPPQSAPPGPPPGRGTGMELDGWLPDGSIFGMPPLPEL
ncbi:hypothetical protein N7468_001069, partial [Penicillium chermesinum]